jgi:hypothetical protein
MSKDIEKLKPVTFIVALTIDPTWVADGFVPDDERMHDILWKALGSATHEECSAVVLATSCNPKTLFSHYQGYEGQALADEVTKYKRGTPRRLSFHHFGWALEKKTWELKKAEGS